MRLAAVPFEELVAYDGTIFPASRPHFLRRWIALPESVALGFQVEGRLAGYGVLRPGRKGFKIGPLFADDERIAAALFQTLAGQVPKGPIFLDAPDLTANSAAADLARRMGLTEVFQTARMYSRGAPTCHCIGCMA